MICASCPATLDWRNRYGYCRRCNGRRSANLRPPTPIVWTPDMDACLIAGRGKIGMKRLAARIGVSDPVAGIRVKQLGLPPLRFCKRAKT